MPYSLRKVPRKRCYQVYNRKTKRIFSKCTTLSRAKKQMRLLNAIDHGFVPTGRVSGGRSQTRRRRRSGGGDTDDKTQKPFTPKARVSGISTVGHVGRIKSRGDTFSNMSNEELKKYITNQENKKIFDELPMTT